MSNTVKKKDEYSIGIDLDTGEIDIFNLSEFRESTPLGMYISHRTGSKEQMISLKRSVILGNLKTLMKNG